MKLCTTSDRLKQLINELNLKQVDILRKCEPLCKHYNVRLGRNDLSQYISGKTEPKQDKLFILAKALDVTEPWLMGYDVPKEKLLIEITELSEKEKRLVNSYRLHPEMQEAINKILGI